MNYPKMSKKRKVDADGRLFKNDGKARTCLCFKVKNRCVLCHEAVSVIKEYNLHRHFDTKHGAQYGKIGLQEKQELSQELKGKLRLQQSLFTKATAKNNAALKASFIVAVEIAKASKSFSEGAHAEVL